MNSLEYKEKENWAAQSVLSSKYSDKLVHNTATESLRSKFNHHKSTII
jgi:hypothetical protein